MNCTYINNDYADNDEDKIGINKIMIIIKIIIKEGKSANSYFKILIFNSFKGRFEL